MGAGRAPCPALANGAVRELEVGHYVYVLTMSSCARRGSVPADIDSLESDDYDIIEWLFVRRIESHAGRRRTGKAPP